jgi:hypothetical protein
LKLLCGSGFSAANRSFAGGSDRGWKAAPTIKAKSKVLKLTHMRHGGTLDGKNYQLGFGMNTTRLSLSQAEPLNP